MALSAPDSGQPCLRFLTSRSCRPGPGQSASSHTTDLATRHLLIYSSSTEMHSVKSFALKTFLRPVAMMQPYHTKSSMISLPSLLLDVLARPPVCPRPARCAGSSERAENASRATALAIAEGRARVPFQALGLTPVEHHLSHAQLYGSSSSYYPSISALPSPRSP